MAVCSAERCHWDKQARSICHVEITRRLQGDYREITRRCHWDKQARSICHVEGCTRGWRGNHWGALGIRASIFTCIQRLLDACLSIYAQLVQAGGCAASKTPKDPLAMLDL
jgi:hypothetical protein